jgi:hypothetical protein
MAMSQKKVGDENDERAVAALTRVRPLRNRPRLRGGDGALSIWIDPQKMPPGFIEDGSA